MSEQIAFSIFDSKAGAFITPFFLPAEGMAVRVFVDSVADPNHQFSKHPQDYTLFQVAVFDNISGKFDTIEPQEVMNGLEALRYTANQREIVKPFLYQQPVAPEEDQ